MPAPVLHRPPRRPHAWAWGLLVSQLLVAVLWWRYGWALGVPALLASHAPFWWGTMKAGSALFSPVLARLPTQAPLVWLTIDDGPSDDTRAMLDLLDAHGAKATFFVVGARAAARPALVREIVRRGHGLGNHSASHPQAWFWALPPWRLAREVRQAQATLRTLTGTTPRWFRAVVGMANPFLAAVLAHEGLARVAWSVRGYDTVSADPRAVVARIERGLHPGAIVLLHEGGRHGRSLETLGWLLQRLDARGYRCVLPEMLEAAARGRAGSCTLIPASAAPPAAPAAPRPRTSPPKGAGRRWRAWCARRRTRARPG